MKYGLISPQIFYISEILVCKSVDFFVVLVKILAENSVDFFVVLVKLG